MSLVLGIIGGIQPFAEAVVYVTPTTPALQTDFISMTSAQYLITTAPGIFPGDLRMNITGKQANPPLVTCPPPTTMDQYLAITTTTLADLATDYYLNGWVNGEEYERYKNVTLLDRYSLNCSTSNFPAPVGMSTSSWKVPKIDTTTCNFVMDYVANYIYEQSFSSPTIVPGF